VSYLLHCEVRWLSKGQVLSLFLTLKDCVRQFLIEIQLAIERDCLVDNQFLNDLAFLVDITGHLNTLNVKLQGSNKLFTNMCNDINSFKKKLGIFVGQFAQKKLDLFKHLKERAEENEIDTDKYTRKVEILLEVFQSRFSDFSAEEKNVELFTNPFTFLEDSIGSLNVDLQLEVVDLQCNSVLKGRFGEIPPVPSAADMITFWQLLPANDFRHLRSFAQRYICRFGSTYRCEQSFSAMKLIKSRNRTRLTDNNLNSLMILAVTEMKPQISKLASSHQMHKSH